MSLETGTYIFIIIMCIGFAGAIYVLIRDRIDIIQSIKPKSLEDFFGYDKKGGVLGFIVILFLSIGTNPILRIILNLFGLIIWGPF